MPAKYRDYEGFLLWNNVDLRKFGRRQFPLSRSHVSTGPMEDRVR